jgi:glyoxylase-like metal-dependent hydrolase (beta-lactamase superfamily II)
VTRYPSVTAGAAATLAVLTDGRAYVGIGPGDAAVYNIGHKPAKLFRLEEYIYAVRRLLEDREEVVPGIRCFRLGGHCPDQTVVTVETSTGEVVIASDAAIFYDSLEQGCPSAGYNLVEGFEALDWIKKRGGTVLPGHDWEALQRHPGGIVG